MDLKNIINNVIEYKYLLIKKNLVHIGYGIDNNYARCMATSIASICMNNKECNFVFHIIGYNLSENTKRKIELLAEKYCIEINIYEVNINFFKNLPVKEHIPVSTYFRLVFPLLLKDVDTLYYIDADVVCLKNANEFFKIDLDNNIVGAVEDIVRVGSKRNLALGLKDHIYFNAGVLIIDIKKWNDFNVLEKCLNKLNENPKKFLYQDQDVLNLILTKKIKYLSKNFNCISISNIGFSDIVLLHFANQPKPWNEKWNLNIIYNTLTKDIYSFYENQTEWKNEPLLNKNTTKNIFKWYIKKLLYKINIIK